jgi:hypothetical protein
MDGLDGWEHMLCISMKWVGYFVALIRSHLVAKAGLHVDTMQLTLNLITSDYI